MKLCRLQISFRPHWRAGEAVEVAVALVCHVTSMAEISDREADGALRLKMRLTKFW